MAIRIIKKFYSQKYSGQIFLMSILLLGAIFAAALILSISFIKDLRLAIETTASVKAFYAADSAMEWQLYNAFKEPDINQPTMSNETFFEYRRDGNVIKTIGVAGRVRRGIEINLE